jgi:predicted dehydrogenase
VLQVGHVERFNPALVAAETHIRDPKYIESVRATSFTCRSTDIGVVLDLMIHDIDVVLSLLDDEVVSVESLGAAVIGPNEDWAQARLTFARGCVVNLFASRVARQARRAMEIVCPEAMAEIDFAARTAALVQTRQPPDAARLDVQSLTAAERTHLKDHLFEDYLPLTELPIVEANGLLEEQRHFAAAIRGEPSSGVSGEQARRALDVAEQILTGIAGHRWEGSAAGTIGPRFEFRDARLRGPHWNQTISARRKAG